MSRGPGRLQELILSQVQESGTPVGKVLWRMAESEGQLGADGISRAFYVNFRRAVARLVATGRLRQERRRLSSMKEIVQLYPDRTRSAAHRRMRQLLLPTLATVMKQAPPRYGPVETERFSLRPQGPAKGRKGKSSSQVVARLRREVEDAVISCLASTTDAALRRVLALVLAKVEEYLGEDRLIEVRVPSVGCWHG